MSEIDSELVNLKSNLSQINGSYAEIDNTLKFKWKEIKKLDMLERDLNKLKFLSELPNMFKQAITKFESKQEGIIAFKEPIRYFEDYSNVLSNYKQTNFMINLYSEIKNYVVRIKTLLSKTLEQNLQNPDQDQEEESKLIIKYLITLGEEKSHLKNLFQKIILQVLKKKLHSITIQKRNSEISYEVYSKLKEQMKNEGKEQDPQIYDQLQVEVEQEANQRKAALIQQNFDKNTIKQSFRFQSQLELSDIPIYQLKKGTQLEFMSQLSNDIVTYIVQSVEDYRALFFYDKETKRVLEILRDQEEKEFKRFVNQIIQPYIDETKALLRQTEVDTETLGQLMKIIHKDFVKIQNCIKLVRNLNVMDHSQRIVEESIRRQIGSQIYQLELRLFRTIENINNSCKTQNINVQLIQELIQSSFNNMMNDISYTIYQYKSLLNYKNSFMKETQVLSINIFQGLQNLFELWQKLNLSMVNQVHQEQELIENAENISINGYSIIAYMNIAMKLESFGIQEIYNLVHSMFHEDSNEDLYSRGSTSQQFQYNDAWTVFEAEILPLLQDLMSKLSRTLRKKYCLYFSEKVNFQIRKYFKSYKWSEMVEPRDIKNEFFEICKNLYQANQCLDLLFGMNNQSIQKRPTQASKQLQTQLRKPELLVKSKKYNAMEMEMDKFLAKKQQIYANNDLQRYVLMTNIIHIVLKSLYENIRYHRFNVFGYQQIQTDVYFLFSIASTLLPNEENNLLNGLFNEVMSSTINRAAEFQTMDETVMESMAQFKQQKLTEDWADKVQQDQIFQILNQDTFKMSDLPNISGMSSGKQSNANGLGGSSMFQNFNEKQKQIQPHKAPRMSSVGSSRSNVQSNNSFLQKAGNQSINNMSEQQNQQLSPRSQANNKELQIINQQSAKNSTQQQITIRSSTQEAQRRRSMRQKLSNQTDLPDLTKQKIQTSFNSSKYNQNSLKQHSQQIVSPSERIATQQNKIKRRVLGGEGSSTDRLISQIVNQQCSTTEKQEQNKENIGEENIRNQTQNNMNSTKSLMVIQQVSSSNELQNIRNPQVNNSYSSRLPMKLQRSLTHAQQNGQNNLTDTASSRSSFTALSITNGLQNPQIEKQMKEVNKQKELLLKLQREKEELENQMKTNERAIQNRMQKLHQERMQMEQHITKASIVMQRYARGFITRLRYKKMQEEQIKAEKEKLNNVDDQIDSAASTIQRAARKMIARKNFRINLYKLMLFKNIVENKVHKEKMQMLYAFEQMIINTEDENDEEYYEEMYGAEDYDQDNMPLGAGAGYPYLSRQFPPMQRVPNEADYLSNPSDIIDEEEYEDSEEEKEYEQKIKLEIELEAQKEKSKQLQKPLLRQQSRNNEGKVLSKVSPNDILEFAGKTSNSLQSDDQYEIEMGGAMFQNTKNLNLNETQNSLASSNLNKRRSSSENRKDQPQNNEKTESTKTQVQQRRIQPSQQRQQKPKVLALPAPELIIQKPVIQRPIDMERIIALSQPKLVTEDEPEIIVPKKKAPKPPVPGQKKKKKPKKDQLLQLMPSENSDVLALAQPQKKQKRNKRRPSRGSSQGGIGILNNYERLLRHRESRTSLKNQKENSSSGQKIFAIEYKDKTKNQEIEDPLFSSKAGVKLPIALTQKTGMKTQQQSNLSTLDKSNKLLDKHQMRNIADQTISSNNDLSEVDIVNESFQKHQQDHVIPQVSQKQDLNNSYQFSPNYLIPQQPRSQQFQNQHYYPPTKQLNPIIQSQEPNQTSQQQPKTFVYQQPPQLSQSNQQTGIEQQQLPQQQQTQSQQPDPSLLYKKCFPGVASLNFKERFPVFSDILQRYNKNLKNVNTNATNNNQSNQNANYMQKK
eukprot:403351785